MTVIADEALEKLLALPDSSACIQFLDQHRLLTPEGLGALLDRGMQLARGDPGAARRLAMICGEAAAQAGAPELAPRATYNRAQTHAVNGEFETALELIETARREYDEFGDALAGVRTNLGKMHVLNELGRHTEALSAGDEALAVIEALPEAGPQGGMITALAHMNRGVCLETMGRYDDALQAYDHAEAAFSGIGMPERLGDVHNNRGIVLLHLGRVGEALAAFEAALASWESEDLDLLQAQTLSNIGEAHLALGSFTAGLNAFERARALFKGIDAQAEHSILMRKTADAYMALNLYPEAIATYEEALEALAPAGMADQHARALWGLGAALAAAGRPQEAAARLDHAVRLFRSAENEPMQVSVLLERAALEDRLGERAAARATAEEALARADQARWPVEHMYAALRMADLVLPDLAAADDYLAQVERKAERMALPAVRYRARSRIGRIRLLQGRTAEAERALEEALEEIEALRGSLAHEALRTSFLADKTGAYDDLLSIRLEQEGAGAAWQALAAAERARSRTLVDMLAGVFPEAGPDEGPGGRRRLLEAELGAVYNRFFDAASSGPEDLAGLQARAREIEKELGRLRLQDAGRTTGIRDAVSPDFSAVQAELSAGDPVVYFHVLGDEIVVFLIHGGAIERVLGLGSCASVHALLQRLNAQWDRFKAGPEFVARNLAALEQSANRVLAGLYDACFAPVAARLDSSRESRLTIIPHDLLHQVPFHALFDGARHLVDRFEIAYAPSATVYALGRQRPPDGRRTAVVAAVPDTLIPQAGEEAAAVAAQLAAQGYESRLLTGEDAGVARVTAAAAGAGIVHLACHGMFRADNPLYSSLRLADDWLTAAEVMRHRLPGALVVLSACESGRSGVVRGDEVIGLPRAFLSAGASAVLVSLWIAQDDTTREIMEIFYQELAGSDDPAAALGVAQRTLKQRHPHPYYWAPFVLMGRRWV